MAPQLTAPSKASVINVYRHNPSRLISYFLHIICTMPINFKFLSDAPTLGAKLRRARENYGLSLMDVAVKVGIHHSQVSRIERGQFKRPTKNVLKLCNFLNVQPPIPSLQGKTPTLKQLQQRIARSVAASPHRARLIATFLDALDSE